MWKYCVAMFLVLTSQTASALSIDAYEQQVDPSKRGISSAFVEIPRPMIQFYFIGVADSINFLKLRTNIIQVGSTQAACVPSEVKLTGELLEAVAKTEILNEQYYFSTYGKDWKDLILLIPIVDGLAKMFRCPK